MASLTCTLKNKLDIFTYQRLYVVNFAGSQEQHGITTATDASGPTHPVYVVGGTAGSVVLHDPVYVGYVQAASCYILIGGSGGGDEGVVGM